MSSGDPIIVSVASFQGVCIHEKQELKLGTGFKSKHCTSQSSIISSAPKPCLSGTTLSCEQTLCQAFVAYTDNRQCWARAKPAGKEAAHLALPFPFANTTHLLKPSKQSYVWRKKGSEAPCCLQQVQKGAKRWIQKSWGDKVVPG